MLGILVFAFIGFMVGILLFAPKPIVILQLVDEEYDPRLCSNRHSWTNPLDMLGITLSPEDHVKLKKANEDLHAFLSCSLICEKCGFVPSMNLLFNKDASKLVVKLVHEVREIESDRTFIR